MLFSGQAEKVRFNYWGTGLQCDLMGTNNSGKTFTLNDNGLFIFYTKGTGETFTEHWRYYPAPTLFLRKTWSKSYSLDANVSADCSISDISVSGYTPLAVIGISTNHGQVLPQEFRLSGNTARYYIVNKGGSTVTNTAYIEVLYYKN